MLGLGAHSWLKDLSLTMGTVRYYGERALLTGPVFGALGFWWQRRRSVAAAGLLAGAFVLEPVAWWLHGRLTGGGRPILSRIPGAVDDRVALGLAGFALLGRAGRGRVRRPSQ